MNKDATFAAFKKLGLNNWNNDLELLKEKYELGKIDELEFITGIQKHIPEVDILDIREAWNKQIGEFPLVRLEFLQMIQPKFKLLLLSNADNTHIERFEHMAGMSFSKDFFSSFEKTYFSFDISLRKPDIKAFQLIINNHNLIPKKTLFIDDAKENINAAKEVGLQTWHLDPENEDVTQLLEKLKTIYV